MKYWRGESDDERLPGMLVPSRRMPEGNRDKSTGMHVLVYYFLYSLFLLKAQKEKSSSCTKGA